MESKCRRPMTKIERSLVSCGWFTDVDVIYFERFGNFWDYDTDKLIAAGMPKEQAFDLVHSRLHGIYLELKNNDGFEEIPQTVYNPFDQTDNALDS